MEKKITKEIRKTVAKGMRKTVGAVEVMRVSEAIGINADAVYSNCLDVNYLLKIVVLDEDEEIDDLEFESIDHSLSADVDVFDDWGICFDNAICKKAIAFAWLRTDGSISDVAIIAKGM